MSRYVPAAITAVLLSACGRAGDPSIEVEIKGRGEEADLVADAETIAEAALDACDIGGLFAWFAGKPNGVYVTLIKADDSTDMIYVECEPATSGRWMATSENHLALVASRRRHQGHSAWPAGCRPACSAPESASWIGSLDAAPLTLPSPTTQRKALNFR